ncbi:MAG: anthranilate phosphoribosyltransferase [Methanomassiliicoccales archaeon]
MWELIAEALNDLVEGGHLSEETSGKVMEEMIRGGATPAQTAALLTALRARGETEEEIAGMLTAVRKAMVHVRAPPGSVDLCGTGGDGARTFNISTAAAFVASACGVPVAKHGNRSVSSLSGSADVLSAMGIPVELPKESVEESLAACGVGFMFAPHFHPALANVQAVRREIGMRSVFNLLGPMANPAGVDRQLIGVYHPSLLETVARVLGRTGSDRVMAVHGQGMDELTTLGESQVVELNEGSVLRYSLSPCEVGLDLVEPSALSGGSPVENARIMLSVFRDRDPERAEVVALNAGAALYLVRRAESLEEGVGLALQAIREGRVMQRLKAFMSLTERRRRRDQSNAPVARLLEERISPEVLVKRAGELAAHLEREVRAGGGDPLLSRLDPALLDRPNVLSVLTLSRAGALLIDEPIGPVSVKGTPLSASISSPGVSLIAEYKPSSPSSPFLPPDPEYFSECVSTAAGVSVLAEDRFFGGGEELFRRIRSMVSLPMLYKDFVISPRQVDRASALGADAVLLVAKSLRPEALEELISCSLSLGLEPLVEVHDQGDLEKAERCPSFHRVPMIGVNTRDLCTLKVDRSVLHSLDLPDRLLVAESGVGSRADLEHLEGYDAVLVGGSLMRADDLAGKIAELTGVRA